MEHMDGRLLRPLAEREATGPLPAAPVLSVIVHSFRQVGSIQACLDSVLAQQLPDAIAVEVLLADDGSDDGTAALLEAQVKQRPGLFRPLFNAERVQYPAPCTPGRWTLLRAMREARGTFVAFVDGDDRWTSPHKLRTQLERLQADPTVTLCVHNGHDVYADGRRVDYVRGRLGRNDLPERFTTAMLLGTNPFPKSAYCYRSAALPSDTSLLQEAPALDWALALHLSGQGAVELIDADWCERHVHGGGIIADKDILRKLDWNLRQYDVNDRVTEGRFAHLLDGHRAACHRQALDIAVKRGERPTAARHLGRLRAMHAIDLRTWSRYALVVHLPGLSRLYHRLRTAS